MGSATASGPDRAVVQAALDLLDAADVSTCGHRELDALDGAAQVVAGYVSSHRLRHARRRGDLDAAAQAALADLAAGATPDDTSPPRPEPSTVDGTPLDLSGFGDVRDRRPGRETEADRQRAAVASAMPALETALAAGRISTAHLDAVVAAWRDLDGDERDELARRGGLLAAAAEIETVERFRRRVRDLARQLSRDRGLRIAEQQRNDANIRRWIDAAGMGHLNAELDPEATAKIWAALDEHLARLKDQPGNAGMSLNRLEVDALVELVTSSTRLAPRSPELVVLIDLATLTTGQFGPGAICETSDGVALSPETARRLACDAGLLPCVLSGDGIALDLGRAQRLASTAQRRALAAMYATCGMPGCDVRFERCRIHHVEPWVPVGPTDLANLLPVCDRHHHQVHEGGWRLSMTPDRIITLRHPDGTIAYHGDTRDRHAPPIDPDPPTAPGETTTSCDDVADLADHTRLHRHRATNQPLVGTSRTDPIHRSGP